MRTRPAFQGATNRLENNLPPYSCEGDPALSLAFIAELLSAVDVVGWSMGKRIEPLEGGSTGEVVPVEEAPERGGWLMGGKFIWSGCSCRVVGTIMY
jgi:hypothetical protein